MENVLIIVNAADIPAASQTVRNLPSYLAYIFDPMLLDTLAAHGIHHVKLIEWDVPAFCEMYTSAHAQAKSFELKVDQQLNVNTSLVSVQSWQHFNLYYFFMAHLGYSALWLQMVNVLEDCKVYIFLCSHAVENYEPSFFPALLLLQILKTSGIAFEAFSYDRVGGDASGVMDLPQNQSNLERQSLLVHLPACNYDYSYVNTELQASRKYIINALAKHWNFPIAAHSHIGVRPINNGRDADAMAKFKGVRERLIAVLDEALLPYIVTTHFRALQAQHWADAYVGQLCSYELLIEYFGKLPPEKMLLTDVDGGFHGPLLRFAERFNIPVLLFPHSKTCGILDHSCTNFMALTHPIQGGVVRDADGGVVPRRVLSFPEQYSAFSMGLQEIRTVGVLLNAPSLNGICYSPCRDYIQGIRKILDWGKHNDVRIEIRCKPGHSLNLLLEANCGVDSELLKKNMDSTMDDFLVHCDLCLMFDHPTSAVIHFLNKGVPIVLAVPRLLSDYEKTFVNLDLVPHGDVDAILHQLDTYRLEPETFWRFRNQQFRDYLNLSREALPLRAYL